MPAAPWSAVGQRQRVQSTPGVPPMPYRLLVGVGRASNLPCRDRPGAPRPAHSTGPGWRPRHGPTGYRRSRRFAHSNRLENPTPVGCRRVPTGVEGVDACARRCAPLPGLDKGASPHAAPGLVLGSDVAGRVPPARQPRRHQSAADVDPVGRDDLGDHARYRSTTAAHLDTGSGGRQRHRALHAVTAPRTPGYGPRGTDSLKGRYPQRAQPQCLVRTIRENSSLRLAS
jgi:hypothetical protein